MKKRPRIKTRGGGRTGMRFERKRQVVTTDNCRQIVRRICVGAAPTASRLARPAYIVIRTHTHDLAS
jgi:hypothetical protein